ncbi:LLM class flavin-dependent oxidoreductase [Psychromicrobium sp. YIM B11713]|uniref:LLM class flavin-dependent oxidoreductase n=1 Tax=Psychromicrobium sp. YIM B11713 TaxID=3145233 RepID=UPI00374F8D09
MKLSILDQSPLSAARTRHEALRSSVDYAVLAEELGYARVWFAEHRGHAAFAGNSPLVLASAVLERTQQIKVGTGGVLIGFHSPNTIGEAFIALNNLHPGRVEAGTGRANAEQSLYLGHIDQFTRMMRTAEIPSWVLGTSPRSAELANALDVGFVHGHFFNPGSAEQSLLALDPGRPRILGVRIVTGPSAQQAEDAARRFLRWRSRKDLGVNEPLPRATDDPENFDPSLEDLMQRNRAAIVTGTPDRIAEQLHQLSERTGAEEIMITHPEPAPDAASWALKALAAEL